jgi:hypothetical protein
VSSTVLTLVVIPAVYALWRERGVRKAVVAPVADQSLVRAT